MENKFKWLYVGCGNIAAQTARSIEKGGHQIAGVYGRRFDKTKAFALKHAAVAYESFEEALNSDFDAVYVATPHTSHLEYTVKALEKHKSVLCEKSLGVSCEEVNKMIEASQSNKTYLCEAMWTWFSDVALTVKKWIDGGELGKIKKAQLSFCIPGMFMDKKSRVFNPDTAGGALLDIAVYPITYCYNLFGYPKGIKCVGEIKNGIDVSDRITLEYDGFECFIKSDFNRLDEKCVITGENGKITVPMFHMGSLARLKTNAKNEVFKGKTDYLTEFSRAVEEIRQGKTQSDYVPLNNTLECMKIMDECRRQMNLVYPFEKGRG